MRHFCFRCEAPSKFHLFIFPHPIFVNLLADFLNRFFPVIFPSRGTGSSKSFVILAAGKFSNTKAQGERIEKTWASALRKGVLQWFRLQFQNNIACFLCQSKSLCSFFLPSIMATRSPYDIPFSCAFLETSSIPISGCFNGLSFSWKSPNQFPAGSYTFL